MQKGKVSWFWEWAMKLWKLRTAQDSNRRNGSYLEFACSLIARFYHKITAAKIVPEGAHTGETGRRLLTPAFFILFNCPG
jgi:hypothetical protein